MNPAAASHVHFDRTKPLILLYPPVFCVGGQRVDLEYDATQFANVGDVLTAEQMVEKYGTLDPTEITNTNEKQGAEEASMKVRQRKEKRKNEKMKVSWVMTWTILCRLNLM